MCDTLMIMISDKMQALIHHPLHHNHNTCVQVPLLISLRALPQNLQHTLPLICQGPHLTLRLVISSFNQCIQMPTSLCGAYCSIMQYVTANKLTYAVIEGLLKLLQVLCPCPNSLPTTLYKLKRFFLQYSSGFEQCVCRKCFGFLSSGEVCSACVDGETPVRNPEFPGLLVHTPFQKLFQTSKSPLNVCHVVST